MLRRLPALPNDPKPIIDKALGFNKKQTAEVCNHVNFNKSVPLKVIFTMNPKFLKPHMMVLNRALAHFMLEPGGDPNALLVPVLVDHANVKSSANTTIINHLYKSSCSTFPACQARPHLGGDNPHT